MIGRNNKNQLKHRILEEINSDLSTICKISNTKEETLTINHIVHYKTGNVQTDLPGLGKYDEILSKFEQEHEYKHAIIKRIFEVVHAKASTQNIEELPRKLNYFAEKLTHLLFMLATHRNNATLFKAPIFLSYKEFFPMSAEHAVAQTRGILKNYKYVLPNSCLIDYDTTNVQNGNLLLIKEGNILIEWLSKKLNNYKLANIARIFDILASM
ncbi:MAG: hypothetical protein AB8U88_06665 [Rickettsia conorii subsp. raoultii]|uniref:Acyl-[acyl-carrier-protein]--UDP-N-acetylglucosamine O-acyltransferase n=3 Tax=Rickettsia conorii TaxID=781 RepID=A0ABY4TYG9_RICCR|nr:hypothetical protein [Rickettsia conorii]URW77447.1 hypothetical protein NBT09_05440 [Rickettsia conorii subsp. raoultii]